MEIKTFSYRFAEEILQHERYRDAYDEIIEICKACPVPVYQGKSKNQTKLDVVQQIMNTYFWEAFKLKGWKDEPLATPNTNEDELRSDFRKTFKKDNGHGEITIQIEVEFGNVASSYRNYFKFQLSYSYDLTDVCILIVPSQHLCTRIDSGVSNFEKVLREIPSAKLSVTVPILVIGLFDVDEDGVIVEPWDVKAECADLEIIKGSKKNREEEHKAFVMSYIRRLTNILKTEEVK